MNNMVLLESEVSRYLGVDVEQLVLLLQVTVVTLIVVGLFLIRRRAIEQIRSRTRRPLDAQRSFRWGVAICVLSAVVITVALQFWSNTQAAAI